MNSRDESRMAFLALKLKAGIPLSSDEQAEWNNGATWRDRLPLLAARLRAGATLSPEDQAYWDREARGADKIAAGLPVTPEEQVGMDRAKDSIVTLRGGMLWVEDAHAPKTVDDWQRLVERERDEGGWIPRVTDK